MELFEVVPYIHVNDDVMVECVSAHTKTHTFLAIFTQSGTLIVHRKHVFDDYATSKLTHIHTESVLTLWLSQYVMCDCSGIQIGELSV